MTNFVGRRFAVRSFIGQEMILVHDIIVTSLLLMQRCFKESHCETRRKYLCIYIPQIGSL